MLLIVGAIAASSFAAGFILQDRRVAHDQWCGDNPHPHVGPHLVVCGAVFEIPGHRTWELPREYAAPDCPVGEEVAYPQFGPHFAVWKYWTKNGEWITWNGGHVHGVWRDHHLVNVRPSFHNWHGSGWQMRVFIYCRYVGRAMT